MYLKDCLYVEMVPYALLQSAPAPKDRNSLELPPCEDLKLGEKAVSEIKVLSENLKGGITIHYQDGDIFATRHCLWVSREHTNTLLVRYCGILSIYYPRPIGAVGYCLSVHTSILPSLPLCSPQYFIDPVHILHSLWLSMSMNSLDYGVSMFFF